MSETTSHHPGEILTFYSYKGGTGRTMALSNVACLLSEQATADRPVLVVDWDLEAPGLHRFLPPRLATADLELDSTPGVIDLFLELGRLLPEAVPETEEEAEQIASQALESVRLDSYIAETTVPGVNIIRAGRNEDCEYSKRVGTFNWEALFRRAPMIYRLFAQRLAKQFDYVLIDSRTGVTDTSGICTYLLPEKLVVVFTPNRQSLTGVKDLVERATSYRRNSDDLRPLMIYPLPSRIEASLQDLRELWRRGSADRNIVGYQPMFEKLFADTYGLKRCDLSSYFDDVQIQQTPDFAYGEEIAVRRPSDRFSMDNSYRVFTRRLVAGAPPWPVDMVADEPKPARRRESPAQVSSPASGSVSPAPPLPPVVPRTSVPVPESDETKAFPSVSGPTTPNSAKRTPNVFLSYSEKDRERVERVADVLRTHGFETSLARKDLLPGADFQRQVALALDASDAIVVFWSQASLLSDSVLAEANEGLRRGVLVPVLLDDVIPPLAFRSLQSADLRRDTAQGSKRLAEAIAQVGVSTAKASVQPRLSRDRRALFFSVAAAALIAVVAGISMIAPRNRGVAPIPVEHTPVPNFVGSRVSEVRKTAELLGLRLVLGGVHGDSLNSSDGVIVSQTPRPDTSVVRGTTVYLRVATAMAVVPTLVGMSLDEAVAALSGRTLELVTVTRMVQDAKPGTIIEQLPGPGSTVAAGSSITVTVATRSKGGKASS